MKGPLMAERPGDYRMSPCDSVGRSSKKLPPACEAAERQWIFLRDGELPEAEAAALRRHLRRCGRCRRVCRLVDGLLAAIRKEPIPEPDDAFWEQMRENIMARIRATPLPSAAGHN